MKPKLQMVCNYYLQGMSVRQALLKVGYSDAYASHNAGKFLKNKEVITYIRNRQADEAAVALADATFVKKRLMELAESPDPQISALAIKQLDHHLEWKEELLAKLAAIEQQQKLPPPATTPVTIQVTVAEKPNIISQDLP